MRPPSPRLPVLAILVAACGPSGAPGGGAGGDADAPPAGALDLDQDGYVADLDCDDSRSDVHPGAEERCDEVDNDCDGEVDEGVQATYYADEDADGFGPTSTAMEACVPPPGVALLPGDCDDARDDRYPGATEVCGDGVINDCQSTMEEARSTCPYDWPETTAGASLQLQGEFPLAAAGRSVAIGDVTGNGAPDLLVGEPGYEGVGTAVQAGRAHLLTSFEGLTGTQQLEDVSAVRGVGFSRTAYGSAVAVAPDLNGDGVLDVIIGTCQEGSFRDGEVSIFYGGADLSLDPGDVDARYSDDQTCFTWAAGGHIVGLEDFTGDGVGDVVVGNANQSEYGNFHGAALLLTAPTSGTDLTVVAEWSEYRMTDARVGSDVAPAGDVDGDGLSDLLIGAPAADGEESRSGAVFLMLGDETLSGLRVPTDDASATFMGMERGDGFGTQVHGPGDLDGDGLEDVLIAAPYTDREAGSNYGEVYVFSGALRGSVGRDRARATFRGELRRQYLGSALDSLPDLDGDGRAEILIGGPTDYVDEGGWPGAVFLFSGGAEGTVDADDAFDVITGESIFDGTGLAIATGDLNQDGHSDLVIGRPSASIGAEYSGSVSVLFGADGF